jgi:hypothetical protein
MYPFITTVNVIMAGQTVPFSHFILLYMFMRKSLLSGLSSFHLYAW